MSRGLLPLLLGESSHYMRCPIAWSFAGEVGRLYAVATSLSLATAAAAATASFPRQPG